MKKLLNKIKKSCRDFMTGKTGFSLVELIVVIAIMAVMAAVLAPALLGYVERSRAQKDDSALGEVVNSVQLAIADQNVYDELLKYSCEQYSCYVDKDAPSDGNKVWIKDGKYYMYNDEERKLDETPYRLDGVMRGVTITFAPDVAASNSATLDLNKGHLNKYMPNTKTYGGLTKAQASVQLSTITDSEIYNTIRATIGDKINVSSQTYRNSEYTVFISMGTTGGNQASAQDAIKVWGQWSGTNLPEGSSVAGNNPGGGEDENTSGGTQNNTNQFQGQVAELSGLKAVTWKQLDNFSGSNVWSDGIKTYYSSGTKHYVLEGDTWNPMTWGGISSFNGSRVMKIDNDYYYCYNSKYWKLNDNEWEEVTWTNAPPAYDVYNGIWTDGANTYYSYGGDHRIFQNGTWVKAPWHGKGNFIGRYIWTDQTNIYYTIYSSASENVNRVFDGSQFKSIPALGMPFSGGSVWSDGHNTYHSGGDNKQYVLHDGEWVVKEWNAPISLSASNIWTDGTNYYYSSGTQHYQFVF